MDTIRSSETSVTIYRTTYCVISEDVNLYQLFCENLEFSIPNIKLHENQFGYSQVVSWLRRVNICVPTRKWTYKVTSLTVVFFHFSFVPAEYYSRNWYVTYDT